MSDSPSPSSSDQSSHEDELNQAFFKRDLDEVHLLMDFVCGRPGKSLEELQIPDPADASRILTPADAVRLVTEIRFPPSQRSRARDSAFLLTVKDHLTGLAQPARGTTIAYTSMFVGDTRRPSIVKHAFRRLVGSPNPPGFQSRRATLAELTFPALVGHARLFRLVFAFLVFLTFLMLTVTALTYWDVAFGRTILQRIEQVDKERTTLIQANPSLLVPRTCAEPDERALFVCMRLNDLAAARDDAIQDLHQVRKCEGDSWKCATHLLRWGFILCGDEFADRAPQIFMASVLSVFGSYVLPAMFGLVGSLIAAIRRVNNLVRDSELGPRDLVFTLLFIPMGTVAGVAVGLFLNPSLAPLPGLSADPSLAASGLGFLAGYGSKAFFEFVDRSLSRAFTSQPTGNGTPQSPGPATQPVR